MNNLRWKLNRQFLAISCLLATVVSVQAADEKSVLIQSKNKEYSVTGQDVLIDVFARVPAEHRDFILSQPPSVTRVAMNLYVRRVMADQAKTAKLDEDPKVAAALQLARDRVLSDAWLERLDAENAVSPDTLEKLARNAYQAKIDNFKVEEKIRVRHILIADPSENGRLATEKLLAEIKAGADFEILAKERSADPGSAAKGGDLGYFGTGVMAKPFQDAAFALKTPGELSGVVASKYGYHIIKFEDRQPAYVRPFAEVKDELINEARSNAAQRARGEAAQRIEAEAAQNHRAISDFAHSQKQPQISMQKP